MLYVCMYKMDGSNIGKTISELRTPCFLVEKGKVERNCRRMLEMCQKLGVQLRPQTKTHKTIEGAILQTGGSKQRIVTSTLTECLLYANSGFDDILYGYPLTPDKINECKRLTEMVEKFHVMVDNGYITEALDKSPPVHKKWSVFLKIDCGNRRAGVWWEDERIIVLAKEITDSHHMVLAGIYAHCGNSYLCKKSEATTPSDIAVETCQRMVDVVSRLKSRGISCPIFGIGSTPSCSELIPEMTQINELHPGNYVFNDCQQFTIGSCTIDDIACAVATRIIGHYPHRNEMLIDCGFTALTKQGMNAMPSGCAIFKDNPGLKLLDMTQEIGKVTSINGKLLDFDKYPIGHILFVFPWHSCATAALHPIYNVCDDNDTISEQWTPCRGW